MGQSRVFAKCSIGIIGVSGLKQMEIAENESDRKPKKPNERTALDQSVCWAFGFGNMYTRPHDFSFRKLSSKVTTRVQI